MHQRYLFVRMPRSAWRRLARRGGLYRGILFTGIAFGPLVATADDGPNSSIYSGRMPPRTVGMASAAPMGWYEVPLPPSKEVKEHDLVTIRVDLGARVSSEGEMQRRKNSSYDAVLSDWLTLEGLRAVKPAPQSDGDQKIKGSFNQLFRATGEMETTESMKFEIAAKVASVLPNGTLVLEAHREVRNNNEVWLHSLTGICSRESIGPGNIVLSKDMADLKVEKREYGHVRDSYKRGWFLRWMDQFHPF